MGKAMAGHCETFEHTADVGLEARAETLAELFEAMGEGLADVICPRSAVAGGKIQPIRVESENVESLLVDFLAELLGLFNLERFLIAGIGVKRIDETSVAAEVVGENYDPARHELGAEIKAVTYHQLKVVRQGAGWVATVILDI